jgi:ferredoxin
MKLMFGGLISVVLLGLYLHLIQVAIKVADCIATKGCTAYSPDYFNEGMAQALSIIGGLVSALVIAELAVTQPGQAPLARTLAADVSHWAVGAVKIVSAFYVLAWIGAGFAAFYVGLYHPKALPALTTLGQAWLGLAVSSAYAYFGIKPTV